MNLSLSKVEETRSPFHMLISKSMYNTTFLDSDVSETTTSQDTAERNCLKLGLLILMRSSVQRDVELKVN